MTKEDIDLFISRHSFIKDGLRVMNTSSVHILLGMLKGVDLKEVLRNKVEMELIKKEEKPVQDTKFLLTIPNHKRGADCPVMHLEHNRVDVGVYNIKPIKEDILDEPIIKYGSWKNLLSVLHTFILNVNYDMDTHLPFRNNSSAYRQYMSNLRSAGYIYYDRNSVTVLKEIPKNLTCNMRVGDGRKNNRGGNNRGKVHVLKPKKEHTFIDHRIAFKE